MRTLYVLGLVILDALILLLGAVVMAITDLDKESGLGALRTLPTLLLLLPHFRVAHYALSLRGDEDEELRRKSRRTTMTLAGSFAAVGAVLLIGLTVAFNGPVAIAVIASALGGAALVYALFVGEKVASRYRSHHPDARRPLSDDPSLTPARSRKWSLISVAVGVSGFVVALAVFRSIFGPGSFTAAAGMSALLGGLLGAVTSVVFTWRANREVRRMNSANFGNKQGIPSAISTGKFDRIRPQDEEQAVRYAGQIVVLQSVNVTGIALLFIGVYAGLVLVLFGGDGLTQRGIVNIVIGAAAGIGMAFLFTRQYRNAKKYLAQHESAGQRVEQSR